MKSTCRKNVSETGTADYLLVWNLTCLAGSLSKCTRPVIRDWNRPNHVRDLSRADEQIQINAEAKVIESLLQESCFSGSQSVLKEYSTISLVQNTYCHHVLITIYLWALYSLQSCFTNTSLFLIFNSICIDLSLSNFRETMQLLHLWKISFDLKKKKSLRSHTDWHNLHQKSNTRGTFPIAPCDMHEDWVS